MMEIYGLWLIFTLKTRCSKNDSSKNTDDWQAARQEGPFPWHDWMIVMSFRWTVSMARLFVTKIGPQVSMQVQWGSGMTKLIWRMGEGPPRSQKLGNQTINTFDESLKPKHVGPRSRWACTKHQAGGLDEECLIRRIWVIGQQFGFLVNIKPLWRNLRSTWLRCCPREIFKENRI